MVYIQGAFALQASTAWLPREGWLGELNKYPGIQSLACCQSQFTLIIAVHILSLNVTDEHDMYPVPGLNCSAAPGPSQ